MPFELGDAQHWIGVKVGSNPELAPRVQLTSVPYAFTAERLSLPYHDTVTAFEGLTIRNSSTEANATSVRGIINTESAGIFSSAVRGQNLSTSGFGIGVWGSQNASGYGVYGTVSTGGGAIRGDGGGSETGVISLDNPNTSNTALVGTTYSFLNVTNGYYSLTLMWNGDTWVETVRANSGKYIP